MSIFTFIIIGIGLSIDSFTACVSIGVCLGQIRIKDVLKIAFFMSFFQGLMPLFGWVAASSFESYIKDIDHWVAFILLSIIGSKMIYDSIFSKSEIKCLSPTKIWFLIGIALATSIDALIVGISFGVLQISIWTPIIIIAITTFIFSVVGVIVGKKIGNKFNSKITIIGGVILIGLGIKILLEHLFAYS